MQPWKFKSGQDEGAKNYRYWTRKAWIIENILRDRAGYYPIKITDNMLNSIIEQMEKTIIFSKITVSKQQDSTGSSI
ncbi:hypothetical protein [Paenibacillus sp. An7]|uniref:hypothetical protein n=1 Tax=Paenibacillus sp. An7 TaxID=2689577 RepID=UPI00135B7C62|nr:hypothetical protein [Paenibacillus sp. An7]